MNNKTAGHTPGPWQITKETIVGEFCTYTKIRDKDNGVIATLHINEEANAALIAAAPELLAMLKAANAAFFGAGTRLELLKALKDSKALIAKAEGR